MLTTAKYLSTHVNLTRLKIANNVFKSIHSRSLHNSPLEGVRVLDLTRIVAGPYCTMILSDLGAEVIKIERPGSGDEARKWGPPFFKNSTETPYFVAVNRNKKSVCVDIKSSRGREILYELAKKSDVLVENYVPGKLDEFKLGYDDLKAIAPQLIYCSITGFGPSGPYRNRPGYDVIAASVGGFLHITGPRGGEPCKAGVAITDLSTGLYAHGAILAALLKRMKTGKGKKIDCNLLSTQVASLINIGSNYLNTGREATRWGTAHASIVPYEAFPTKDGYFTIGAGSDPQFKDLCERLNRPDLPENDKFKTNQLRVKHRDELIEVLNGIISTKTKQELSEIFEGGSFPCGPVNTIKETFDDPHVKEIKLVETMEHPVAGDIRVVGPPVQYSEGGNYIRASPPTLGQHTENVLETLLGYDKDQLAELKKQNVIQ
jgi:succinate--hydroxymethylglutarate CoA-transferase